MKKKIILFLLLLLFIPFNKVKAISIEYSAHIQGYGWLNKVSDGEIGGSTGKSLRMEAISINVSDSNYSGSVEYSAHIQGYGWLNKVSDGETGGSTGKSLRMEAIKINLSGELADHYNIYYRAHIQGYGWLDWVSDGEVAGSTGKSLRMEALQIKLVSKDDVDLMYKSHSVDGWNDYVSAGVTSGTTGQSKCVDQIRIKLINNTNLKGNLYYQVYGLNGWEQEVSSDEVSGVINIPIEAIKIRLSDDLKEKYNIYYRVHASYIGWMGWTKNGNVAGTVGYFNKIEAIEIRILYKDDNSIIETNDSSKVGENSITYSSHVQGYGWQNYVEDGKTSGSTGESLRLEAYKIKLKKVLDGDILYKTYVDKRGWSQNSSSDGISGTTGLSRNIEAISISLNGQIANYYDIYYRTHVSYVGWLGWAKNGETSGGLNSSTKIEAIEIKLIRKGRKIDLNTDRTYVTGTWKNNNTNYYDYYGRKATGFKLIDGVKHYFNSEGKLYGKNVQKVIDVSSWQGTINWDTIKKNEDIDSAIIRVGWGTSYNDPCGLDSYYDRNMKEVQRLGIPYGVYIYAYAETVQAAEKEADFVISKLNQYNAPKNTWVWYDAEINSISRNTYNTVIPAFVNKMKKAGYNNVGVYSGVRQLDTTNGNTNTSTIRSYPIWVSQYYKDLQYTGTYKGWQYASDEHVDGISGNVDVSMFKK